MNGMEHGKEIINSLLKRMDFDNDGIVFYSDYLKILSIPFN